MTTIVSRRLIWHRNFRKINESKLKVRKAIRKVSVVDALELRSPNEERGYVLVSREQ